ncbi:MAG: Gfo/Idh/MocA family oxidoreductase [Planctomycetaceae bacterium]|jgi:predicted dehydrogenase|nr:Gfo/Idh/MocA family oxidoreductase [Planctomycetaceae bacterium]
MSRITRRRFLENSLFATFSAGAAAAMPLSVIPQTLCAEHKVGANDRLGVLLVGAGSRGGDHIKFFAVDKRTEIRFVCDPDSISAEKRCADIEKIQGTRPKAVADMRTVLDDKSIDIVTCAATNHWHALTGIWAMQAEKHCFIEKPISYNIHEGKALVAAAKKYKRIVQTGSQCRSLPVNIELVKFVRNGGIGEVKFARGLCYKRRAAIGPLGEYPVPPTVNYDLWSGPAQIRPVTRPRFHYDWHWQRYYGNGDLGNQGPHQTDIARWLLGVDRFPQSVISYGGRLGYDIEKNDPNYIDAGDVANTEVSIYDYGDKCIVFETRGLKTPILNIPVNKKIGTQVGVIAYGKNGYAIQGAAGGQSYNYSAVYDLDGKLLKEFKGGSNIVETQTTGATTTFAGIDALHYSNFVEAILADNPVLLNADARCGALSAAISHLGNISYYLGEKNKVSVDELKKTLESVKSLDDNVATLTRTVEHLETNGVNIKRTPLALGPILKIDVEKEVFIDNAEANAMITRNYRAPYVVPEPENV